MGRVESTGGIRMASLPRSYSTMQGLPCGVMPVKSLL
jgi:hypothetical protein